MSDDRMMATSPTRLNGDFDHIYDPNFTEEINQKMQVPKRIKVNGENEDDVIIGIGGNHPSHAWENEKFEMHVPERILVVDNPDIDFSPCPPPPPRKHSMTSNPHVPRAKPSDTTVISVSSSHWRIAPSFNVAIPRCDGPLSSRPASSHTKSRSRTLPQVTQLAGQEQCVGTKKAPVEDSHEHVIIPPDPGFVRVQTPPRVISLAEHYFPAVDDIPSPILDDPPPPPIVVRANKPRSVLDAEGDHKNDLHHFHREGTPLLTDGMTSNEEIAHLRRQLAKLNRRVMSIELENLQRQQYEKIVYAFGIAYVIWKTLLWLRNS